MIQNDPDLTHAVARLSAEAGFARVAIAPAGPLSDDVQHRYRQWIQSGQHGGMEYLTQNFDKRFHPALLVPGARSVICLATSYAPRRESAGNAFVASYARGRDYHKVLKTRCHALMDRLRELAPHFDGRAFVDSAPLAERSLAAQAGLGWIGRNGCLIVPGLGSYVVLAEIVCNLDLAIGKPLESHCDGCLACLAACPTGALRSEGTIDCGRCLSYLTIEHEGPIAPSLWPQMGSRVLGCDNCQQACPHNIDVPPGDPELTGQHDWSLSEILSWDQDGWDAATAGSAIRRASYIGLMRNAAIAAGNSGDTSLAKSLEHLRVALPQLAEIAAWATERLRGSL